ncbi:MAG: HAD family hydrolase [Rhodanobacter sp.]
MLNAPATPAAGTVFLVDVDNTLFDNDRFAVDLGAELERLFGAAGRQDYFEQYEALREDVGYADYLGALQRFRQGREADLGMLRIGAWLLDYPFADHLYPHALDAIAHLRTLGTTAILSDGDIVFQPHKIEHSGLWQALDGEVLVYVHKQHMLDAVQQRYPADHYVMVDDKAYLLSAMKQVMGTRLTTVFVRQGHYAAAVQPPHDLPPDMQIDRIGDLCRLAAADFLPAAARALAPG